MKIRLFRSVLLSLFHLTAGLYGVLGSGYCQRAIIVYGTENHALTFYAHHLARRKVGNEEHVFADKGLWLVELGYAGADGTVGAAAVVDGELEQFAALLDLFAGLDVAYPDVKLLPFVEGNVRFDGAGLIGSSLVGALCGSQLV